ncbi:hypothetical protein PHLCEN_2v13593 [Hermanssonia centrifuga]|uniref:Uncharacterized protein n=1 Tax=Hermanssonia centrifuga TaxID=98765 RepID=A0A2R6NDW0_9APHY|nr:hypothetical protein PHLCEN_2v13593 [Hermanssonia centrifuga]
MIPYIHSGDPAYAPPVLRAPSPSSSIGTEYDQDETPHHESLACMPDTDFAHLSLARLNLHNPRQEEAAANKDPLLRRPKSQKEERANSELFEQVMDNLRREVRLLQENDLFEQTVLRGSLVTDEQQPSSDIDAIMRSMMGPPTSLKDPFLPPSPSTARSNTLVFQDFALHPVSATSSATATGTPRTKSKGKARRV